MWGENFLPLLQPLMVADGEFAGSAREMEGLNRAGRAVESGAGLVAIAAVYESGKGVGTKESIVIKNLHAGGRGRNSDCARPQPNLDDSIEIVRQVPVKTQEVASNRALERKAVGIQIRYSGEIASHSGTDGAGVERLGIRLIAKDISAGGAGLDRCICK